MTWQRVLAPLLFLLPGCAGTPKYAFTATGAHTVPRAPNCEFAILDMKPTRPFDEVGRVDAVWHPFFTPTARTPAQLRGFIQEQVCAAGGDAVIAQPDCTATMTGCPPNGEFWSARIIRYVDRP